MSHLNSLLRYINNPEPSEKQLKIGLALGSGASRGWSHIGVIKALVAADVRPDVVCGTSVGAMVGAAYLAGNLDELEKWVMRSTRKDVLRFFEIQFTKSGFVDTRRMKTFLHDFVAASDLRIEDLPKPFGAVATDLHNGREVWFTDGNLADAVFASMALPGLFPTVQVNDRWLVDGGLVNPVPVSVCTALGADYIIAVNLNSDIVGKHANTRASATEVEEPDGLIGKIRKSAQEYSESLFPRNENEAPGLFDVVASSINIFQDRITRSRMAGDPPNIVISPRLSHIGLLDFHRAEDAIREGENRVARVIEEIRFAVHGAEPDSD